MPVLDILLQENATYLDPLSSDWTSRTAKISTHSTFGAQLYHIITYDWILKYGNKTVFK